MRLSMAMKVRYIIFMEAFMDKLEVESSPGMGTVVKMEKTIGKGRRLWTAQSL